MCSFDTDFANFGDSGSLVIDAAETPLGMTRGFVKSRVKRSEDDGCDDVINTSMDADLAPLELSLTVFTPMAAINRYLSGLGAAPLRSLQA